MTSAERLCIVAARSEGLLVDFVIVFLARWGLKLLGLGYANFQPVLSEVAPPLRPGDVLAYPASAVFWEMTHLSSGMPELVFAGMWCLYAVLAMSLFGKTIGMRQAGTMLADAEGRKPSFWRVLLRQLLVPVSSVVWIGFIFSGFTPNAEAFHDLVSRTRVVYAPKRGK